LTEVSAFFLGAAEIAFGITLAFFFARVVAIRTFSGFVAFWFVTLFILAAAFTLAFFFPFAFSLTLAFPAFSFTLLVTFTFTRLGLLLLRIDEVVEGVLNVLLGFPEFPFAVRRGSEDNVFVSEAIVAEAFLGEDRGLVFDDFGFSDEVLDGGGGVSDG
jgi:hypothetical protein